MKKWLGRLFMLLAILAVVCLLPPYVLGQMVEKQYKNLLQNVPIGHHAKLELVQYHRGWFDSEALLKFTFAPASSKIRTVMVGQHIEHGPLIFDADGVHVVRAIMMSKLAYTSEQRAFFEKNKNIPPIVTARTLFPVFGGIVSHEHGLPFTYRDVRGMVNFKGFDIAAAVSKDGNRMQLTFDCKGVDLKEGKNAAEVGALHVDTSAVRDKYGIWIGQKNIKLQSVEVAEGAKSLLDMQDVVITVRQDEVSAFIDSHMSFSVEKLLVHGQSYAPSSITLSTKHVNAAELAAFGKKATLLLTADEATERQSVLSALLLQSNNVLNGLEFSIDALRYTSPFGLLTGTLDVQYPQLEKPTRETLLKGAVVGGEFLIPQDLMIFTLEQFYAEALSNDMSKKTEKKQGVSPKARAKKQIQDWLSAGYLNAVEDGHYKVHISVKDRVVKINGRRLYVVEPPQTKKSLPQQKH